MVLKGPGPERQVPAVFFIGEEGLTHFNIRGRSVVGFRSRPDVASMCSRVFPPRAES